MNATRPVLIALALVAPVAHAGKLDDALLDKGLVLLTELRAADVKTVGVLPFLVKRGSAPAGRDFVPLSTNLTTRLENALVFRQNLPDRPVIHVVRVPNARVVGWDARKADYDKLFTTAHPPAWGDKARQADAFLTGLVTLADDRKSAKVVFQLLKPGSWVDGKPKPVNLLELTVDADPTMLRDLAFSAVTSRAWVPAKKKVAARDEPVLTPDDVAGLKIEIEYDGIKQEIKSIPGGESGQPVYGVPAPKAEQKVAIYLTRVPGVKGALGAVLKVGGKSTFEEQDMDPLACRKWIFSETKTKREAYTGFSYQKPDGSFEEDPFALVDREVPPGARSGWIDLDVFVSRPDDPTPADGELLISMRGVGKKRPATLAEAREELAKANNMKLPPTPPKSTTTTKALELYKAGKPVPVTVTKGKFPNPVRAGGLSIRLVEQQTKEID